MKQYDTYKDSGIEWADRVPENWKVQRLKYSLTIKSGDSISVDDFEDDGAYNVYGGNGFIAKTGKYNTDKEDIVIGRVGAKCGNVRLIKGRKWVSDNALIANTSHNYEFMTYLLEALNLNNLANKSAQPLITGTLVRNCIVAIPSFQDQLQIVCFLNEKTSKIDQIIRQKELLLEKLQAKRQAIINEAVTKGLNPNAPMKLSGVEWLGDIPDHWEIKQIRYLIEPSEGIKIGPFGSALKLDMMVENGPYKVFGQENVIYDDFSIGKRFISNEKFKELSNYKIEEGDILITMMGTTGKSKVVPSNIQVGIMDSHLIRLRASNKIAPHFLSYLINDSHYILTQIQQLSRGAIMSGLNSKIIKSLFVLLPPVAEQKELMNKIRNRTKQISDCENLIKMQIEKLNSYKQSLITEVVTGKIKVV